MNQGIKILSIAFCLFASACTYDKFEPAADCNTGIPLEIINTQPTDCGLDKGSLEVGVADGFDPANAIQFSINGIDFKEDGTFENLAAGSYTVTSTDGICESTIQVLIENEAGLNASLTQTASDCGEATGVIQVDVSGASGAVNYTIDNSNPQSSGSFNNLEPGKYLIGISDDSGCTITLEATVTSKANFAQVEAIINTSCAISGCHAGNVSPDLTSKSAILNNAGAIRTRTASQSMPPSSSGIVLSESEINTIACWVEDGAPE